MIFFSRISLEERNYIESSISEYQSTIELPKSTPWIKMLSSIPVWSVATGHLASNWAGKYSIFKKAESIILPFEKAVLIQLPFLKVLY